MNLVFVNSAWPESWGGGEKWTVEAAGYFHARGHTVLVVGRPSSLLVKAGQERGIMVEELRFGGDFDPFALTRVRRLLKTHHPDLVVVNFNKEAWHFGLARKLLGIPLLARHGFPLLRNSIHHRFLLTQLIDKLVVNAESIRDEYARLGLPVKDIEIIHNGVGKTIQKTGELRRRCKIDPDDLLIVGAGRLESQKNFPCFLEIARTLSSQIPRAKFVIMGSGPDEPSLRHLIHDYKLENSVTIAGFVPDYAAVIGDADLFLLTSEKEGTPNVLLEAMAAGVTSLSFAVGSVPQLFGANFKDNLMAQQDTKQMIQRATEILENESLRKSTAKAMQMHIMANFSFEASMKRYEDIILQMTGVTS